MITSHKKRVRDTA